MTTTTTTPTTAPATLDRNVVAALLVVMLAIVLAAFGPRAETADVVPAPSYLEIGNDSMPTGLSFLAD